jgi:energy-coupling factor transporter ATP-binding protein EcfA2
MTEPLELVTFEDLVTRIAEAKDRAHAEESRAGWMKLLDVASDMAGRDNAEDDVTAGRTWYLTRVRISGYQGIGDSEPLEISFPPTPGITVVDGPNGSGKSSIADAIETALQGRIRPASSKGSGGNTPVWDRIHLGRDADEAVIELTLLAGDEVLEIGCTLEGPQQALRSSMTHRTGYSSREVDLHDSPWKSAVTGHQPVYAYAAVERQVQLAKDLQEFLEGLLAFGSCFGALEREVGRRSEDIFKAKETWGAALNTATQNVQSVDESWASDGQTQLDELKWPSVDEDPDEWLERESLTDIGQAIPEVTSEHLGRLREEADALDKELAKLQAAETSIHAQLAGPLQGLHEEGKRLEDTGNACPVCDTTDVPWFERLGASLEGLVGLASIQQSYRTAAFRLSEAAEQSLSGMRKVLAARDGDEADLGWWDNSVQPFFDAQQSAGNRVTGSLRSAATVLTTWVSSPHCERLIAEAAAESDRIRQWHRARRGAVDEFVSTWRSVAADAREAPTWESAKRRFKDLQDALRRDRAGALGAQTNAMVQALLADAGITLKSITVQGTKASLQIVDQQDKRLEPAMLSAGQRNAILLAPMLAVSGGGPFGFVILDDPVHAFDQVRVDHLAKTVADLAVSKRVIVLTHDERLKEHLIARHPDCDVRGVQRDTLTGAIRAVVQGEMWQTLVEDAFGVVNTAANPPGNVARPPHDIVRGLCRQAFDNALRSFVIRAAVQDGRTPENDLADLDEQNTTSQRMEAVRGSLTPGSPRTAQLDDAKSTVSPYMDSWNRATHGNEPIDAPDAEALRGEIKAARQACKGLTDESS